ncbi:Gti1/Pac2 family-domain-containing protein [Fomitopsis betulina]|nr:Gti1/Pac2 family-domain-containing protein [Fomitopsis betulina]
MQQPTLQNVRIRSTRDACQIFYAVARHVLRMTTQRLDAEERRAIKSGNVYVWEERCANAEATGMGMERWTDGMGWGPSRVRDDFLFYHQRESGLHEESGNPSARWANMMKGREPRGAKSTFARSDVERLIKQTYSVHVSLPEDRPRGVTRKWHLTAYFSQTTLDSLGTIDSIPGVGDVPAPENWFRSARASKGKRTETGSGDELVSAQDPWGLGFQPSPSDGMSQFPVESTFSMQGMQYVGPGSAGPAAHPAYTFGPRQVPRTEHPPVPGTSVQPYGAPTPPGRPHLPTLHDAGLKSFRDPSPLNFTSSTSASSSSDYDASPRLAFVSPLTPPPRHPRERAPGGSRALVPLDVLQAAARRPRDPVDEQFLRRLSRSNIRGADIPRSLAGSPRRSAPTFNGEDIKPRMSLQAEW